MLIYVFISEHIFSTLGFVLLRCNTKNCSTKREPSINIYRSGEQKSIYWNSDNILKA